MSRDTRDKTFTRDKKMSQYMNVIDDMQIRINVFCRVNMEPILL